jgi:hypothetical protein
MTTRTGLSAQKLKIIDPTLGIKDVDSLAGSYSYLICINIVVDFQGLTVMNTSNTSPSIQHDTEELEIQREIMNYLSKFPPGTYVKKSAIMRACDADTQTVNHNLYNLKKAGKVENIQGKPDWRLVSSE